MKSADGLIRTREVFEPLYGQELTNQEVFSINQNLLGFFETLIEIDDEQKQEEGNEQHNYRSTDSTN